MNKAESKYFNTAIKMDKALISLLKKKSLEYITVSEICKKAGVNRSTFYLHYETISDLIDETTRYLLDDFLSYFDIEVKKIAFDIKDCELDELVFIREKYLYPYLSYMRDNKEIFSIALLQFKTFKFDEIYRRLFENIFNPVLDRFDYSEESRNYVMMYYLNGVSAIINEWLKNDCDKTIEEIIRLIKVCIYGLKSGKRLSDDERI